MDDRLKPCPFCGNKNPESYLAHPQYRGKKDESDWCYWSVGCPECGAWFKIGYRPPKTLEDAHREAVEAWNRRAGDIDNLPSAQPEPEHTMEEFMYGQDLGSLEDGSL